MEYPYYSHQAPLPQQQFEHSAALTNSTISNAASFNSGVLVPARQMAPQQQQQQTVTQVHYAPAASPHSMANTQEFVAGSLWPTMIPLEGPPPAPLPTHAIRGSIDDRASFSLESSAAASQLLAEFPATSISLHNQQQYHAIAAAAASATVASAGSSGGSVGAVSMDGVQLSIDRNNASPQQQLQQQQQIPSDTQACDDESLRSNLFVCMLPPTATDAVLLRLFEPFGAIDSAKVMLNIHTGQSRGIAFVKFQKSADAMRAMNALDGSLLFQQKITVRIANAKAAYAPGIATKKTFVRNVPASVSKAELQQFFSQFGAVTEISVLPDAASTNPATTAAVAGGVQVAPPHDMQRRMILFVSFATKESAKLAAEKVHTSMPFAACNGVPLLAKVAEDTMRRNERLSKRTTDGSMVSSMSTQGLSTHTMGSSYGTLQQQAQVVPAAAPINNAHLIFHPSLQQQQHAAPQPQLQQQQQQQPAPTAYSQTAVQQQQQQAAVYYVQQHQHNVAPMVSNHNSNLNNNHLNQQQYHQTISLAPQQRASVPQQALNTAPQSMHTPQPVWYQQAGTPTTTAEQQQEAMYLYWKPQAGAPPPAPQQAPQQQQAPPPQQQYHQPYYYDQTGAPQRQQHQPSHAQVMVPQHQTQNVMNAPYSVYPQSRYTGY